MGYLLVPLGGGSFLSHPSSRPRMELQFSWTGRGYVTITDGLGQDWRGRCKDIQRSQEQSILDQDVQLAWGPSQVCEKTLALPRRAKVLLPARELTVKG